MLRHAIILLGITLVLSAPNSLRTGAAIFFGTKIL